MDPRPLPWALMLLGPALALALGRAPVPEVPEKLCGHHFVRALVRVCGGPRWSLEAGRPVAGGDREWEGCGLLRCGFLGGAGAGAQMGAGVASGFASATRVYRPAAPCVHPGRKSLLPGGSGGREPARGQPLQAVLKIQTQIPSLFSISVF